MIPHNKPWITEDDRNAVLQVLESNQIADLTATAELTGALGTALGNKGYCCLTNSGTAAIFMALKVLNLPPGSLVALPAYACRALPDAVLLAGLEPVIADVRHDLNIDPASLQKLSSATGAIQATIAVNTFGVMADIATLQEYGGKIIEDCCHSFGGRHTANLSLIKTFSFYATKLITGGQGGALWSEDTALMELAGRYLEKNVRPGNYLEGFNFRTTDLQSALIGSQLKRITDIFNIRSAMAGRYHAALPETLKLINPPFDPDRMYYRFVVYFPSAMDRDFAYDFFIRNNIEVSKLFRRQELLHNAYGSPLPGYYADEVAEKILSIPIYPALTGKEITHIEAALRGL